MYPVLLPGQLLEIYKVLKTPFWNQSSLPNSPHIKLENLLADKTESNYAIAVGNGGIAIQMAIRALELGREDEVIHQVDTCVATPFSLLNAQVVPVFHDIDLNNFMLDLSTLSSKINRSTKAILATHMWGNMEDIYSLKNISSKHDLFLIEDCCLALGTTNDGIQIGGNSTLGIFSFGSTKTIQAGGGAVIVTNNKDLAERLRSMRHYGDTSVETGLRDSKILSWNGRISEITAAIALKQIESFSQIQEKVLKYVHDFENFVGNFPNISLIRGFGELNSPKSYNQLILKIDFQEQAKKGNFLGLLRDAGVEVFHANFEPVTSLSFFQTGEWKKWVCQEKWDTLQENYRNNYFNANKVFSSLGIGLHRNNFLSLRRYKHLKTEFLHAYLKIFS